MVPANDNSLVDVDQAASANPIRLTVATNNPDSAAETYVRQHIRGLAPGSTSVLYFDGTTSLIGGIPNQRIGKSAKSGWIGRRWRQGWSSIKYGYPTALVGAARKSVMSFLSEQQSTSLLAEFGPTGCILGPICHEMGIRMLVNFHGYDATVMPQRRHVRQAYSRLPKYAAGFVCGSRHFAKRLATLGLPKNSIHVIPCGIELDEFDWNQPKNTNLIVAVGRLTEKKAPHLTIRAFAMAAKAFPESQLEIIGDGPLRYQCEAEIRRAQLGNRVILHGAQPHAFVKRKLAVASLFVQHSVTAANGDTESQGISLLEAMASGVPVITTNHNGFCETIDDHKNGYLVEEFNVESMADKIRELLSSPQLAFRMGVSGRAKVEEKFNSTMLLGKLRQLFCDR